MSPVTIELSELSPALLQPQDTVVAILRELLATLPSQEEKTRLFMSSRSLYSQLKEFNTELRAAKERIQGFWEKQCSSSDPICVLSSLSGALAAWESTPWTTWDDVTKAASEWQGSVDELVDSWAQLAWAATELRNTCREVATKANRAARATTRARELQAKAARDGTAQENMVELGQALGREEGAKVVAGLEAQVRREARVAARRAARATMERQEVEAALGLLERLVAACDKATTFLWEWQFRVGDIKADLEEINEVSPDVPVALVAKVAEAERLWVASASLVESYLLGTVRDIIGFYFGCGPDSPSEVAEQYREAIEAIPWLLRAHKHPQSVPEVSPVSTELQQLSPALLQPQVTVVATLGVVLATLPRREELLLFMSPRCLYRGLEQFTRELRDILYSTGGTWWRRSVTSDDDDGLISLSRALAAYKSIPWTPWSRVTMAASKWRRSMSVLMDRWAKLARKATKLCKTCREVATEAADVVAITTARARELQDEVQENMELGQALGREEGAEVVPEHEARVRREARVAASEAIMATKVRQRLEVALGLLERLVAACDEATAFPRELRRLLRDIKVAMKGTNEASRDVPEDLLTKVAVAERLWEANARLAKDHLLGALDDIKDVFSCDSSSSRARGVTEKCQKAIEDIPNLLHGGVTAVMSLWQ